MPDVGRLVDRLRHGAYHERFDERAFRGAADATRDGLQVARAHALGDACIDPECTQGRGQALELLRFRLPVHPIQGRHARLLQRLGHRHVGEDHALLDEPVRVIARAQLDAAHAFGLIDDELGLRGVEIQGAAVRTRLVQGPIDIDQHAELRQQRAQLRARRGAPLEERLVGERIGEAGRRAHDRRVEARALQGAVAADEHVRGKAQPVDLRGERAQVVRERRRQHRQHAGREIHRSARAPGPRYPPHCRDARNGSRRRSRR